MSSTARVTLAVLLVGTGAALGYVGGFIWWAEPTPAYRLTANYRFWHTWGAGLFLVAGALLVIAAVVALRLRARNSN